MRKLIIAVGTALAIVGCSKPEPTFDPEPTLEGEWELKVFSSLEDYPLLDSAFYNEFTGLNITFIIEGDDLYTLQNDTLQPIPLLGFVYQNNFHLSIEDRDGSIYIGGEKWKLTSLTNNLMSLENVTDYGMMGNQLRQFVLAK